LKDNLFLQALPLKAVLDLLLYALLNKAANGKSRRTKCSILSPHQYFVKELHLAYSTPPAHYAWTDKQDQISTHIPRWCAPNNTKVNQSLQVQTAFIPHLFPVILGLPTLPTHTALKM